MIDCLEFEITKSGDLKYDRIKSMSILKHELKNSGYDYSINDIKIMFDNLINNTFCDQFDRRHKHCFDLIFNNNEYKECDQEILPQEEYDFPKNWIPPFA